MRIMANKKSKAKDVLDVVINLLTSENSQKFLCGTYSNGDTRSLADAIQGEFISPEDRAKWEKKKKDKKDGSGKKNKKGKKKTKDKVNIWNF